MNTAADTADTVTLNRFNRLPPDVAVDKLQRCCGSDAWAQRMVAGRPYNSRAQLLAAADRHWLALPVAAHLQAFEAHAEIGDTAAGGESRREQAGVAGASTQTRAELARLNRDYRQRFGFIFLICASGLSADAMLVELRARIENDRETELANAAEAQRKITRLRLQNMLAGESTVESAAEAVAESTTESAATVAVESTEASPPSPAKPAAA